MSFHLLGGTASPPEVWIPLRSQVSEEELQDVINEIKDRPRKILGYMTAREKIYQLLKEEIGGCD